jgi:molecular chaperone Hsp33
MAADRLNRFLLRDAPVRGEIVSIDDSWREVVARHDFPPPVRDCLGQLCAAGLLLSASLKFDGTLVLQIHGDGPVALLVVECEADGRFRATAKLREGQSCPDDADLSSLVNANGQGRFVVTLDPGTGSPNRQPYQGIVPFEGNTVSEVLERYMARSEQVPTRLWIAADGTRAAGLLLQRLPDEGGKPVAGREPIDADGWNRMQQLAETVTRDELLGLEQDRVLHRLFWQEALHGFESREARFACSCSVEKVAAMLRMLGREEVDSIIAERGNVSVRCEFCNTPYEFDAVDSVRLFLTEPEPPGSDARH